jgi:hypothetical protein
VEVDGELRLASNGIHACRLDQLPYWIDAELWQVELDGPLHQADRLVLGPRGRLIRRIEAWTGDAAIAFALACLERSWQVTATVLRASGAGQVATALEGAEGAESLMTVAYGAAGDVPEELAPVVLDAGDTAFAVHSRMSACLAGYLAARTAGRAAAATGGSQLNAERVERRWQADWLVERLGLEEG